MTLSALGVLCVVSPVLASDVSTIKKLPMSYLKEKIRDLLDGQEVFFPPLKTTFVVCSQKYIAAPVQENLIVNEDITPLSPKYFEYYKSYQAYEVQLPGENRIRTVFVCAKR